MSNNFSSKTYNDFYKKFGPSVHHSPERFLAISNLCSGDVLDLACGAGDLARYYNGNYVGIDISDVAIQFARDLNIENARFYCGDATQPLNQEGRDFDTIVMAEFLEHIKDDSEVFKNVKKWCGPNTRIIISVPNGDRVPDETHLREFTTAQLRHKFSALGLVQFHNWPGFDRRILMTIDLNKEKTNPLALVMIVKNEAKGLEQAILSCIDLTDEIVIAVDTKSNDDTLSIAKRYADTLTHFTWKNNFAAARNEAQLLVKSKWSLSLDGHEYVKNCTGLEDKLKLDVDALLVQMEMEDGTKFFVPKIYKSSRHWNHAVHNALDHKTHAVLKEFTIQHNRIKGQSIVATTERDKQRNEMMISILNDNLLKNKKDSRSLFYLARHYKGNLQFKKSLKYFNKYLKLDTYKGERWLACYEAAMSANAIGKHLKALKYLRLANKTVPNRWEISKSIGMTYLLFGRWEKAIEHLVDSFKINKGDFLFNPEKKRKSDTWDKIGFCFFHLKEYKKAKVAWEEAITTEKNKAQLKLLKKRIELMDRGLIL